MRPASHDIRNKPFNYLFSNTYGNEEQFSKAVVVKVFEVRHNQRPHVSMVGNMLRDKERNPWWK